MLLLTNVDFGSAEQNNKMRWITTTDYCVTYVPILPLVKLNALEDSRKKNGK